MDRLVALAVNRRYLMVGMFVAVLVGGLIAFRQLNIEAYPDPTPPMVDIVTQSPGLSAEEIERYITIPIETQVAGIKNLRTIRTISLYGLSDVKLQFSFDYTYDEALQQVLNRLSQLAPLPGNAQPTISPLSPIGEIFRYRLEGPPNYSVLDLKTLQDWVLQRRFRAVPGVDRRHRLGRQDQDLRAAGRFQQAGRQRADAAAGAAGRRQRQHQCRRQHRQYRRAIRRGARRRPDPLDRRPQQHHGVAVAAAIRCWSRTSRHVTIGEKPRLGIAGLDQDDDIVQGIVLMRRGEQSSPTIARVEQLVASTSTIPAILPPGVQDRADLRPQGPDRHHHRTPCCTTWWSASS